MWKPQEVFSQRQSHSLQFITDCFCIAVIRTSRCFLKISSLSQGRLLILLFVERADASSKTRCSFLNELKEKKLQMSRRQFVGSDVQVISSAQDEPGWASALASSVQLGHNQPATGSSAWCLVCMEHVHLILLMYLSYCSLIAPDWISDWILFLGCTLDLLFPGFCCLRQTSVRAFAMNPNFSWSFWNHKIDW